MGNTIHATIRQIAEKYGEEPENIEDYLDKTLSIGENQLLLQKTFNVRVGEMEEKYDLHGKPYSLLYLLCWYGQDDYHARFRALVEDENMETVIREFEGAPLPKDFQRAYELPKWTMEGVPLNRGEDGRIYFGGLRGKWKEIKSLNHKKPKRKFRLIRGG